MTDWWEGGIAGSRGGGERGGSVRYISYSCSFINLANLTSCSAIRLSLGGGGGFRVLVLHRLKRRGL